MPASTTTDRTDTPAGALGPTALVFGALAAAGLWPTLTFGLLPWTLMAGGLAVTFGLMGVHHARRGAGRMVTSVTGAVLGTIGLLWPFVLIMSLY
ncbi:hypothetical protein JK359_28970 [Streptomyces actinomycinicus]|uniref:DUF4190 domain-containing protein n=1 Tax=Streptomyces actinomycinicus TaxID=1695166 RepID=A0A937EPR6_9ACTN|nr:hypothetical protein [Streptomyces actinomycinicus]MBL1085951.1 hypothetical protein [Streptomyces actinomycinicus]